MKVLGIETATQICGVAIVDNKQLIGEYRLNINTVHSERLVSAIAKLLQDVQLKPKDLDVIAVSIGPGSFTGLRIGLAVAKGMAFTLAIPIVAVPALEALVWQAPVTDAHICAVLPARKDAVYACCYYKKQDNIISQGNVRVIRTSEVEEFAKRADFFIGDGIKLIREHIQELDGRLFSDCYSMLSGFTIAMLGSSRFDQGMIENVHVLEPFYVQEFIAQKPKQCYE